MGRFIPGESVEAAQRWQFGQVGDDALPGLPSHGHTPLDAQERAQHQARQHEELALARESAFQQGFDAGMAAARELAEREIDRFMSEQGALFVQRLSHLGEGFAHELGAVRDTMAGHLAELACELARQVVRRELATRADSVVPVAREALALLSQAHAPRVMHLHPDDFALVQQQLAQQPADALPEIRWQADASIERGGCRLECAGRLIDGSVARRWLQATEQLGVPSGWSADAPPVDGV